MEDNVENLSNRELLKAVFRAMALSKTPNPNHVASKKRGRKKSTKGARRSSMHQESPRTLLKKVHKEKNTRRSSFAPLNKSGKHVVVPKNKDEDSEDEIEEPEDVYKYPSSDEEKTVARVRARRVKPSDEKGGENEQGSKSAAVLNQTFTEPPATTSRRSVSRRIDFEYIESSQPERDRTIDKNSLYNNSQSKKAKKVYPFLDTDSDSSQALEADTGRKEKQFETFSPVNKHLSTSKGGAHASTLRSITEKKNDRDSAKVPASEIATSDDDDYDEANIQSEAKVQKSILEEKNNSRKRTNLSPFERESDRPICKPVKLLSNQSSVIDNSSFVTLNSDTTTSRILSTSNRSSGKKHSRSALQEIANDDNNTKATEDEHKIINLIPLHEGLQSSGVKRGNKLKSKLLNNRQNVSKTGSEKSLSRLPSTGFNPHNKSSTVKEMLHSFAAFDSSSESDNEIGRASQRKVDGSRSKITSLAEQNLTLKHKEGELQEIKKSKEILKNGKESVSSMLPRRGSFSSVEKGQTDKTLAKNSDQDDCQTATASMAQEANDSLRNVSKKRKYLDDGFETQLSQANQTQNVSSFKKSRFEENLTDEQDKLKNSFASKNVKAKTFTSDQQSSSDSDEGYSLSSDLKSAKHSRGKQHNLNTCHTETSKNNLSSPMKKDNRPSAQQPLSDSDDEFSLSSAHAITKHSRGKQLNLNSCHGETSKNKMNSSAMKKDNAENRGSAQQSLSDSDDEFSLSSAHETTKHSFGKQHNLNSRHEETSKNKMNSSAMKKDNAKNRGSAQQSLSDSDDEFSLTSAHEMAKHSLGKQHNLNSRHGETSENNTSSSLMKKDNVSNGRSIAEYPVREKNDSSSLLKKKQSNQLQSSDVRLSPTNFEQNCSGSWKTINVSRAAYEGGRSSSLEEGTKVTRNSVPVKSRIQTVDEGAGDNDNHEKSLPSSFSKKSDRMPSTSKKRGSSDHRQSISKRKSRVSDLSQSSSSDDDHQVLENSASRKSRIQGEQKYRKSSSSSWKSVEDDVQSMKKVSISKTGEKNHHLSAFSDYSMEQPSKSRQKLHSTPYRGGITEKLIEMQREISSIREVNASPARKNASTSRINEGEAQHSDESQANEQNAPELPPEEVLSQTERPKRSRKAKKKKTATNLPDMPASLSRNIMEFYIGKSVSTSAEDAIERCVNSFWKRLFKSLDAYANHAGRTEINMADFELFLYRLGYARDRNSLNALIETHLPMELRSQLIPMATAGNVLIP